MLAAGDPEAARAAPTAEAVGAGRARLAAALLFALLLVVCVGLPFRAGEFDASGGEGDLLRQATYALLFGASMLVTWRSRWVRSVPLSVILVFAWCWLSVSWAIEPGIAVRRLLLTSFIAAIILATVEATGTDRALKAVAAALLAALTINYLAVLINPMAIHLPGESSDLALIGNWRGATNHKNYVGAACAVTVMVLLLGPPVVQRPLRWLAVVAALYFLWRTQSKTSMALLVPALGCAMVFLVSSARGRRLMLPGLVTAVALIFLAFGADIFDMAAEFLSQPAALTGRTDIWAALLDFAQKHPWLGSGFGSFWGIGERSPILLVEHAWAGEILTGHNGYLDLLVQLGVPGLLLAVVALMIVPLWRVTHAGDYRPRTGALLLALLVFSMGHNVTETSLLSRDLIMGVVFLLTVALAARYAREAAAAREAA